MQEMKQQNGFSITSGNLAVLCALIQAVMEETSYSSCCLTTAASEARQVDPNYARVHNVMFADLSPYMLVSQESLNSLNKLLREPVPINRFRPNILVTGCEPFSEDFWREIKINNFTFVGVRLCSRCKKGVCYKNLKKTRAKNLWMGNETCVLKIFCLKKCCFGSCAPMRS